MKLLISAGSHIGQRKNNEDAFLYDAAQGLFVVADGMGGYEGGEVASELVVHSLLDFVTHSAMYNDSDVADQEDIERQATRLLDLGIRFANREVASQRKARLAQMGSTVVAAIIRQGMLVVGHVGDSRAYCYRRGELRALTQDHSLYTELKLAAGDDPHAYVDYGETGHVLTRAIGVPGMCLPDLASYPLESGDTFVLCTDGLSDALPDARIAEALDACGAAPNAETLIAAALEADADDNVTAIVIHCI